MKELKLNKKSIEDSDFDVIPNMPSTPDHCKSSEKESYVKVEDGPGTKKLFANKKANIAFIIIGSLILLAIIAAVVLLMIVP